MTAILEDFDHDAEWVEYQRYPGAETFRGPSGVERSIRKWWDAWSEIAMDVDETIDLGDRVVLAGYVTHAATTAKPQVVRVQILGSRDEALEAVRLSE